MRQITIIFIIPIILISCNNSREVSNSESLSETKSKIEHLSTGDSLTANSSLITRYQQIIEQGGVAEKKVAKETLVNIKSYSGEPINEEILTIGNIDGIGTEDTIRSYLVVKNDTVYLYSKWVRDNEMLWGDTLINPYMHINDENPLFEYEKSPVWTRLTIAKDYAVPDLSPRSDYKHITTKWVLISGMYDFNKMKLKIDSTSYNNYLQKFEGMLFEYGEPEIRKLLIWHEPTKRFVSYYSP